MSVPQRFDGIPDGPQAHSEQLQQAVEFGVRQACPFTHMPDLLIQFRLIPSLKFRKSVEDGSINGSMFQPDLVTVAVELKTNLMRDPHPFAQTLDCAKKLLTGLRGEPICAE